MKKIKVLKKFTDEALEAIHMINFTVQTADVPQLSNGFDVEYVEEKMIAIYGRKAGVDIWGEYIFDELTLNIGKYKGLNQTMAPRLWNYCEMTCGEL